MRFPLSLKRHLLHPPLFLHTLMESRSVCDEGIIRKRDPKFNLNMAIKAWLGKGL